jgi:hypothetical protein
MTYRGHIENGVVVLEPGARLAEGTQVRVEPLPAAEDAAEVPEDVRQLREGLLRFSGIVKGGPTDLARNHDHYLHGAPRK